MATNCSAVFLIALSGFNVKLILKLLILGAFLGRYHRHLLSLPNESMTSIAHLKSYEFERISHTTHPINREKVGYILTFNFFNTSFYSTHIIFNSYIFVTGRKHSDRKVIGGTNISTVHYPQVSQEKSEDTAYFLLTYFNSGSICSKTAPKINHENSLPYLISYVCITYLSLRSHCDLENPLKDLKVCSKKYFFLLSH